MQLQIPKSHAALYSLLINAEKQGRVITKAEILATTNWKEPTFDTYKAKGQLADFLAEIDSGRYEASSVSNLTALAFSKKLSQSKHRRGLGHNFKSRLARALLKKSRDNMMLALELYNRPSLENRLDGFALLFCVAWEQLLKAELIERDGEDKIYRASPKRNKVKETISLQECIEKLFSVNDKQRKNLERIIYYRNAATHLLMPEVQAVVSRLFQAGVLNYVNRFEAVTEQRFLETSATGILTLIGELRTPTVASLNSNYGKRLGNEIFELARTLEEEIKEVNDWQFAVPVEVNVVFARKGQDGALELVASADEGIEGLRRAIVVEKSIDRKKTHVYNSGSLINEINRRLYERYDEITLERCLPAIDKHTHKPIVNSFCLQSLLYKLKWKNADNEHHYASSNPTYHWYSDKAVEELINRIVSDNNYLANARKSYSNRNKRTAPA